MLLFELHLLAVAEIRAANIHSKDPVWTETPPFDNLISSFKGAGRKGVNSLVTKRL